MAATDRTREKTNFQKKQLSHTIAELEYTEIAGDGSIVALIPAGSLIVRAFSITGTGVTALGTVDVLAGSTDGVGGTEVFGELAVDGNDIQEATTPYDCKVETELVVKVGAGAVSAGDFRVGVEYLEYNKQDDGQTTNFV